MRFAIFGTTTQFRGENEILRLLLSYLFIKQQQKESFRAESGQQIEREAEQFNFQRET